MKLRIKKIKAIQPITRAEGFRTTVITNGTAGLDELVEIASKNTTMHKAEMKAANELFIDSIADALKKGYIVDLGVIGKLYPSVNGKWTATEEEQTKDLLTPKVNYRASAEVDGAIRSAQLSWVKVEDEEGDVEPDDDNTNPVVPSNEGTDEDA